MQERQGNPLRGAAVPRIPGKPAAPQLPGAFAARGGGARRQALLPQSQALSSSRSSLAAPVRGGGLRGRLRWPGGGGRRLVSVSASAAAAAAAPAPSRQEARLGRSCRHLLRTVFSSCARKNTAAASAAPIPPAQTNLVLASAAVLLLCNVDRARSSSPHSLSRTNLRTPLRRPPVSKPHGKPPVAADLPQRGYPADGPGVRVGPLGPGAPPLFS